MSKTTLHSSDSVSDPSPSHNSASSMAVTQLRAGASEWFYDQEARGHSSRTIILRRMLMEKLLWFLEEFEYKRCGTPELRAFFAYLVRPLEPGQGRWGNPPCTM